MKTAFFRCMTVMALAFWVSSASANSINVDFSESPGTHLTIYDNAQSSGTPDRVLFSFTNHGPSSLAAIYFDDDGLFDSLDSLYESEGVDFTTEGGGPANLPSGKPLGFTTDFSVRVAKNTADGIDQAGEYLGIVFNLKPGVTIDDIIEKVVVYPDIRGPKGPWIVDAADPVPEPASMVLFGIGTAGLIGMSRKRRNNK